MTSRMMASWFLCAIVLCNQLSANWSLVSPVGYEVFDNEDNINGSGYAPTPNIGADFSFEQWDYPNQKWVPREKHSILSFTCMGIEMWGNGLSPQEHQQNAVWPLSVIDQGMRQPDYKTRIDGGASNAEAKLQMVVDSR